MRNAVELKVSTVASRTKLVVRTPRYAPPGVAGGDDGGGGSGGGKTGEGGLSGGSGGSCGGGSSGGGDGGAHGGEDGSGAIGGNIGGERGGGGPDGGGVCGGGESASVPEPLPEVRSYAAPEPEEKSPEASPEASPDSYSPEDAPPEPGSATAERASRPASTAVHRGRRVAAGAINRPGIKKADTHTPENPSAHTRMHGYSPSSYRVHVHVPYDRGPLPDTVGLLTSRSNLHVQLYYGYSIHTVLRRADVRHIHEIPAERTRRDAQPPTCLYRY